MSDESGKLPEGRSQIVLYQTEGGKSRVQVRMEAGTVWLTQRLLADLYQVGVNTINHHIKSIYEDGELLPEATIRQYRIVQTEGARQVEHYNLDMIPAVGYRIRLPRGVQFRQWATERLPEYLVKGFALDDERLKGCDRVADYFDELLVLMVFIDGDDKTALGMPGPSHQGQGVRHRVDYIGENSLRC